MKEKWFGVSALAIAVSTSSCFSAGADDDDEGSQGGSLGSSGASGSGGASGTPNPQGGSSGSSGASGSGGSAGQVGPPPTLGEACLASCETLATCDGVASDCAAICVSVEQLYQGACASAATAVFQCEGALSCPELTLYREDRRNATCGAEFTAYAAECAYQPTPPAGCSAFCAKAEECAPLDTVGSCADNCNVNLGLLELTSSAACASANDNAYACFGTVDCAEMTALLQNQTAPVACAQAVLATDPVCN